MSAIKFMPHQEKALKELENFQHAGVFLDMGLGKTFVGAELAYFNSAHKGKSLLVCPISGMQMWIDHLKKYYEKEFRVLNLRDNAEYMVFISDTPNNKPFIGVINYDLVFRREDLYSVNYDSVVLDESSCIKNSGWKKMSKRAKFFMKLKYKNFVHHWILLSGTPTDGRYEKLVSQVNLLGWEIEEDQFWKHYVEYEVDMNEGFPIVKIERYKNTDRLTRKLSEVGCIFMKSENVIDLPEQIDIVHEVLQSFSYQEFRRTRVFENQEVELIGDTTLTMLLYSRMLCGHLSPQKLDAMHDILNSTSGRIVVFYNFNGELDALITLCNIEGRPYYQCNGHVKDYENYTESIDSVVLCQYQSASKLLNLQEANRIIYFTPPLSSEDFEQSKKRIHRIGQNKTCFYHYLISKGTIEESIYATLKMRKDYTDKLFLKEWEVNA